LPGHDIIVVGASAGGVEALTQLARRLPVDLPAAVFVVLHIPAQGPSYLPDLLSRAGPLPAAHPEDGEPIKRGRIYVAPPDNRLLIEDSSVRVVRGPMEKRYRPAVDPLFRSAAREHGPRVVGVVLSGALDDGTAGLLAVKKQGGIAVVQEPREAAFQGMPRSALENVEVDYRLPIAEIASLVARLAKETPKEKLAGRVPEQIDIEVKVAAMEDTDTNLVGKIGKPSVFSCPDCHGILYEIHNGEVLRFRCQVGHAYSADSMLSAQTEALERALWAACRSLEERADLVRKLAERAHGRNNPKLAARFEARAQEAEEHADTLRSILKSKDEDDVA